MAITGLEAQSPLLDAYIADGLENNLALRQKETDYLRSQQVLKQARALFYPDISLNARYTVAEGGRIIEFPVGNLLNPVYQSLNSLLQTPRFTDIENQEFTFYRPTEHETKLQLVQPIIDTRLIYSEKISRELSNAVKADADAYARQLVAEIKTAYFTYLKTNRILELLDHTRSLLVENIRVNERLFQNDMVTIDKVFRSNAELSKLEQQYAEGLNQNQVAKAWFNFLLNRPLETEIIADFSPGTTPLIDRLDSYTDRAVETREELEMLKHYSRAAENALVLNQTNKLPSLYAAVDYGFQGTQYEFNGNQDFLLASLVLRWNIFHGFENRAKIREARIARDLRQVQVEEAEKQIRLQIINAYYALLAAEKSIAASREEFNSASKAFRVIERKYGEGRATLIEFIDARTSMTQAEQRLIISNYDHHIKYAELERVACLFELNNQIK
jgi:outer membrane protein TolC